MTEGAIARWFRAEGDAVRKGDILFEVETDKATMDYEAPEDGVLTRIVVPAGVTVPCGTLVALLNEQEQEREGRPRKTISPRARRLAAEHGVEWERLEGSGDGGQVTEKDVQAFLARQRPAATPAAPAAPELSRHRRILGERLVASARERAHIYLKVTTDMTAARELHAAGVNYNDLFVKALAICLAEFPLVNASLEGGRVRFHDSADIGLAVAADDEHLFVPVLRDAARKSMAQLRGEREALTARARQKKLAPEEMTGGTFTLSNLGMYGVEEFTAIINPPETGILAVGAVTEEPRAVGGAVAIRPVLRAVLGVDHRLVDGALGARFLARFKELIENPGFARAE
jgi:pyruvate dehydrogenase E2 component (dihydrolipoamide acetyltransferase)